MTAPDFTDDHRPATLTALATALNVPRQALRGLLRKELYQSVRYERIDGEKVWRVDEVARAIKPFRGVLEARQRDSEANRARTAQAAAMGGQPAAKNGPPAAPRTQGARNCWCAPAPEVYVRRAR